MTLVKLIKGCCTLGLMITTIVSFVFISRAKDFFQAMKDANCSDEQTNDTIGFLADTAIKIFDIWIAKIVLDTIKIVYYLVMIYRGRSRFMKAIGRGGADG
mmetsp:Transcript_22199/g.41614  ORF Transcript_22199/g.41614 Transcript_22199/m.41614 type:complete len:101 (+) Transcript_22199:1305-1607(+)